MIDWNSTSSETLLNPRLPDSQAAALRRLVEGAPAPRGHVWLAASGSSGSLRMVALSKAAMLSSAGAVNALVGSTSRDCWLRVLPDFHVGGLAIEARAALSGARVLSGVWNARHFVEICRREEVTLSSLVPAQVSDLVVEKLEAPGGLRAIFVGGGRLAPHLLADARRAGWPLLPSFGMTECASQIATALPKDSDLDEPPLALLPHLRARVSPDGRLSFSGESLFSGYAVERNGKVVFEDPKDDGWFVSEDVGRVIESDGRILLEVDGRSSDFLKIGGESTSMARLDAILDETLRTVNQPADAALIAMPDERLGHVIHLAIDDATIAPAIRDAFDERVLPFERVRKVHIVDSVPRSALGKLLRNELMLQLTSS